MDVPQIFFHLQIEEHIDTFQFSEIMNDIATNVHIQFFGWT